MVTVNFYEWEYERTVCGLKQYDTGQILRVEGLNLPSLVEFHFAYDKKQGRSYPTIGTTKNGVTEVKIPDFMLENGFATMDYNIYAFIYVTDAEKGETVYMVTLPVISRPQPEGRMSTEPNTMSDILKTVRQIADDKVTKPATGQVGEALVVESVDSTGKPNSFKTSQVNGISPQQIEQEVNNYFTKNPLVESDPTVPAWAKEPTKPTYTASEVGALPSSTKIPSALSEMTGDATHRTVTDVEKQTWNGKAEQTEVGKLKEDLTNHRASKHFDGDYANLTNKPAIPDVSGFATKVELNGKADKSAIPTKLPNPQPIKFTGGVVAEYDGSGAVTIQIPSAGGNADVERIEKLATDTNVELEPNKLYIFPEMASLTYSLKAPNKPNVANEYHFVFKSGASATQLVHAVGVNVGAFKVEPNKVYEVSIMENLLTSQSWAVV